MQRAGNQYHNFHLIKILNLYYIRILHELHLLQTFLTLKEINKITRNLLNF
jgi:hypothetical protein